MKVVHSLGWYFPDTTGGTEVYVSQLVKELHKQGIDGVIAAARDGYQNDTYSHEGIEVFRYPVHPSPSQQQLRGLVPYGGFDQFVSWLSKQNADIYHQHSMVGGCGIHHLEAARKLGLRTVVTVHLPGTICLRGSMMLYGSSACDGHVETVRCGVCWAMSKGLTYPLAAVCGHLPKSISRPFAKKEGPLSASLATPTIVETHLSQLQKLSVLADRTIAISNWLYEALIVNGFPPDKLVLCQTGIVRKQVATNAKARIDPGPLRVGFLGRLVKEKGIDILINAFKRLPGEVDITLSIYGINSEDKSYEQKLRLLAKTDPRIDFKDPIAPENSMDTLRLFDLVAIPSQFLETGPLVALEAHQAQIPVLASNLGGLAERIRNGIDGLLVPAGDEKAWSEALLRLATNRKLLGELKRGIRPIRSMGEVAGEMVNVYEALINHPTTHVSESAPLVCA